MSEQIHESTEAAVSTLVAKLGQFHESLAANEQTLLRQMLQSAVAVAPEVTGFASSLWTAVQRGALDSIIPKMMDREYDMGKYVTDTPTVPK